jgi:hypothetical protein
VGDTVETLHPEVDTDAIPTHSAIATLFILILFSGLIRLQAGLPSPVCLVMTTRDSYW